MTRGNRIEGMVGLMGCGIELNVCKCLFKLNLRLGLTSQYLTAEGSKKWRGPKWGNLFHLLIIQWELTVCSCRLSPRKTLMRVLDASVIKYDLDKLLKPSPVKLAYCDDSWRECLESFQHNPCLVLRAKCTFISSMYQNLIEQNVLMFILVFFFPSVFLGTT